MEMKCPICGSENIESHIKSKVYEYKGHRTVVDEEIIVCKECEESVFSDETSKRIEDILRDIYINKSCNGTF